MYSHAEGTKIDWKGDKDLTKTVEVRKQRNKSAFVQYLLPGTF